MSYLNDSQAHLSQPPSGASHQQTSLRPRTKRPITNLDLSTGDPSTFGAAFNSNNGTPFETPIGSRAASPIPSKHPSRPSSTRPAEGKNVLNTSPTKRRDLLTPSSNNDLANSLSGLWGKSWTSLQGLASNVLGSDASAGLVKDKSPQRQRRPYEATHSKSGHTPDQWGPQIREENQPGAGSKTQRQDLVRERKRQELLSTNGTLTPNTAKYKRRTSDEFDSTSVPPAEDDDREALVYIHHVVRTDTLAGIAIKFSCQPAIIKKANRLWSNDAIQTRKTIVIPVDACDVRGRPVSRAESFVSNRENGQPEDSTSNEPTPKPSTSSTFPIPTITSESATLLTSSHIPIPIPPSPSLSQRSKPSSNNGDDAKPPWRHDSWVQLPHTSATNPIEIGRLSARDLGYFPRARRKASHSFSDPDTPSLSLELPRASDTFPPIAGPSSSTTNPKNHPTKHRHRSSSSASQKAWSRTMLGPGGVGSLAGKGASAPGPADDKLNKALKKHLPGFVPSGTAPLGPAWETAADDDDTDAPTPGTAVTHSYYSGGGGGSGGLENLGGAIEGWVRKIAKSTAKALEQANAPNGFVSSSAASAAESSVDGSSGRLRLARTFSSQLINPAQRQRQRKPDITGATTGGDLIELSSAFEVGSDDDDDHEPASFAQMGGEEESLAEERRRAEERQRALLLQEQQQQQQGSAASKGRNQRANSTGLSTGNKTRSQALRGRNTAGASGGNADSGKKKGD